VGLTAWRQDADAEALLANARAAVRSVDGDHTPTFPAASGDAAPPPLPQQAAPASGPTRAGDSPAVGRAGGA
jgi:hypothetical protein